MFIWLTALGAYKILDLESGSLFEVGAYSRLSAYEIFNIYSKCCMSILQQNK